MIHSHKNYEKMHLDDNGNFLKILGLTEGHCQRLILWDGKMTKQNEEIP